MSTRKSRWGLAFTFTSCSLIAAAGSWAVPGGEVGSGSRELLTLELDLAQTKDIYLHLDPARRVLEVKSRGLVLESVPLFDVQLLAYRTARSQSQLSPVELPRIWSIQDDPALPHRKVIAPDELVPFSEEAEANRQVPVSGGTKTKPETVKRVQPASYRLQLDGGWMLQVAQPQPPVTAWSRFHTALRDGWERLRGRPGETPNLVALTVTEEVGRRIHHVFRPGAKLLVGSHRTADAPASD